MVAKYVSPILCCAMVAVACAGSWRRVFSTNSNTMSNDNRGLKRKTVATYAEPEVRGSRNSGYNIRTRLLYDNLLAGYKHPHASQDLLESFDEFLANTEAEPIHSPQENNLSDESLMLTKCSQALLSLHGQTVSTKTKNCTEILQGFQKAASRPLENEKADDQLTTSTSNSDDENPVSVSKLHVHAPGDLTTNDANAAEQLSEPWLGEVVIDPSLPVVYEGNNLLGNLYLDNSSTPGGGAGTDYEISTHQEETDQLPEPVKATHPSLKTSPVTQSDLSSDKQEPLSKRGHPFCPMGLPFANPISENEPLPWTCRQRKRWRSLDDYYYPNRLHETVCESRTCMGGHFNCTAITYTTHLLRVCLDPQCNDERTPTTLRRIWRFEDHEVTVGCMCQR